MHPGQILAVFVTIGEEDTTHRGVIKNQGTAVLKLFPDTQPNYLPVP